MPGDTISPMPDFEPYLAEWRQRRAQQRDEDAAARDRAMAIARALSRLLVDRYGVRRVILVGSLARGDFAQGSDIDLVVEGLADDRFFAAGADLDAHAEGMKVDLVPLEAATSAFRDVVAGEGIVLA